MSEQEKKVRRGRKKTDDTVTSAKQKKPRKKKTNNSIVDSIADNNVVLVTNDTIDTIDDINNLNFINDEEAEDSIENTSFDINQILLEDSTVEVITNNSDVQESKIETDTSSEIIIESTNTLMFDESISLVGYSYDPSNVKVSLESDKNNKKVKSTKSLQIIQVKKRDGRLVNFSLDKILNALKAAFNAVYQSEVDDELLTTITSKVVKQIKKQLNELLEDNHLTVEKIQDIIEDVLLRMKEFDVAKTFIRYRAQRTQMREANNNLISLYRKIHGTSAEELELKRDNANINGETSMGTMLKIGTESNKYFLLEHALKAEYANAHKEGYIHIHDLDFSNIASNCLQLNLQKLFHNGFCSGHGYIREPNSIRSYAALSCIAIQANQNEQFGGQSINLYDFYMAPGVRKSFRKAFKHNILIAAQTILRGSDLFTDYVELVNDKILPKYLNEDSLEDAIQDFIDHNDDDTYSNKVIRQCFNFAFKQACKDVEEETAQAMEAVVFNLNTMQSRAGSQVPFSSLNLGCDTSNEGRLVTKKLLDVLYKGLGHNETSIFPIVVFQLKKGINYDTNDPNYDLFKQAIKCSAKRLFPTYMNEDATYNAQYYDSNNIQTLCATMGCRTRVMGNVNGPQESGSRGNFAFCTLALPTIALEAKSNIDEFFKLLDKYIQLIHDYLLERFNLICQKHVYNYPFLMGQKIYMGSENLRDNDTIFEALKHSSLSIGFVGLAECLTALIGHHHGETAQAQQLGLLIVKHIRAMTDKYIQQDHLNWSTFATPAESCAGRLCKLAQKKFGKISGVTDKDYFTNSSHIPVAYPISAANKIAIEAPYHAECNAGCIAYTEFDGDATKNLPAFEAVIRRCHDSNMNYFAINTKSADYCPACGNASFINDKCPICGYHEHVDNQHYEVNFNLPKKEVTNT